MRHEFWLEGPIPGIPPHLMPVAHALLQAQFELREAAQHLTPEQVWLRPNGAASIGFHLRHLAGSMDRLVTYAMGEPLSEAQRTALAEEKTLPASPIPAGILLDLVASTVGRVLDTLGRVDDQALLDPRLVGRAQLPSNVLGLLFHAAEHTMRHTGQVITTAKIVRG